VTIDRAIQDRAQRADSSTPFSRPSDSGGSPTTDPFGNGTTDPSGNGGFVDPFQQGNQPSNRPTSCSTSAPSDAKAAEIAAKVTPGLVNINTMLGYQAAAAAGTGIILSSDGLVLTNNHVIDDSTTIRATVVGTGKTYDATVLGTAKTLDVALIRLDGASGLPTVKIDDSAKAAVCDPIVAAGNAGGRGGDPSVVSGVVTALNQSITASDENGNNAETLHQLIETNAPIQPGDSGGPLIDADGEVIGMNTAASSANRFQSAESVGYAIPIANALDVVDQIKAGKESATVRIGLPGIMGVQIDGQGVRATVIGVAEGSPAAKAGIAAGSTITAVDGSVVTSPDSVGQLLDRKKPGDKVSVSWTDPDGSRHTEQLTLMAGPAD
jgi:S1-C subfamily serine protease